MLKLVDREYTAIFRAIVCFGPASENTGLRPGEYFQVTVDPNMAAEGGEYLRFGYYKGDELVGWQRCAGLTVCKVLLQTPEAEPEEAAKSGYTKIEGATVTLPTVKD